MHSMTDARRQLVQFLDHRAFEPVLRADPADFPESARGKLDELKRSTKAEQERFHAYDSAEKVVRMFRDDLDSAPARAVHRDLDELGLPTLDQLRTDFEQLAADLGVGA